MSDGSGAIELDVRGEVCPYPELRTRRRLEGLEPGQILRVITDHAAAVRNVPDMVARDGTGEVLEVESRRRGVFLISIRRTG